MSAPFSVVMARRVKDPIARLLAAASEAGVRFRIAGATLEVAGADVLPQDDREVLRRYLPDLRLRLEPPGATDDLLALLDVEVEVITDAEQARAAIAALSPGTLGFDIETAPIDTNGTSRPWIKITKSGKRAVHQDAGKDSAGLDPFRARPRLAQIYDPVRQTVLVIDLRHVPVEVLAALAPRRLIIHNAAFELVMLGAVGVHLQRTGCTLLLARLVLGAERGGLRLADVAAAFLNLELPKQEQVSDWAAERLSYRQLEYAALDAVIAFRVAQAIWSDLDSGARRAFALGNATVPVVAGMRLAGIPFDQQVHAVTVANWERDYTAAREQFVAITGAEIPPAGAQRSAWLLERLPDDMAAWWPRTDTGLLRTRTADFDRLAAVPEIRPLLDVIHWDKRLRSFGRTLLDKVRPNGRLHMDLKPAWTKTGRCGCSKPNLQQLPQDTRKAVVTQPGRVLVIADYNQIELRVASELSADAAMRQVFRDGVDMHRLNAAAFLGNSPDEVTDVQRSTAKRIGFGTLYGSGARGLVASAWSMYRIEMTEAEAQVYKDWFYARYPRLRQWQNETANVAQVTGVLSSIAGRPLRQEWEARGELHWTQCCNYPVQSSAADVMLRAMALVHAALDGHGAQLILQIHDELVVECAEPIAGTVAALLEEHMVAAYVELFPDAPVLGLVDVAIRTCWAKPPKVT